MTATAPPAAARRYPGRNRRVWIPLAIVLAVLGVAWLAWAGVYGATGTVSARIDAFTVLSDTRTEVRVTIDRPGPDVAATCLLFAQAVTYERVAELPVRVEVGGSEQVTQTYTLHTVRRATAVDVEGCRTVS